MNTNLKKLFVLAAALVLCVSIAPAQTYTLVPTTLSAAITDSSTQVMQVASVTTVSGYTVVSGTVGYIDNEEVTIKPLNNTVSGTTLAIIRGQGGTAAAPHASGALVFLGPPEAFFAKPSVEPQGSCTRSKLRVVPFINVRTGEISDCVGGQWTKGVRTAAPLYKLQVPNPGGTAYTSLNSAGTTLAAGTTYCSEVNLPANKLLTGIGILAGTTVATDKWLAILYDSAGNLIANSATAGATTATASTYQQRAFTSTIYAVGPAQYFACFQSNGTTDTARMVVTGTQDQLLTKSFTGTFATIVNPMTVPTTFTTAVGPYVYLY